MTSLIADNFNDAYPRMVRVVLDQGQLVHSRNGITIEARPFMVNIGDAYSPVVTSYGRPVNVAFALAEVLWILSGSEDVSSLAFYNSRIRDYSDDGVRFNAAYGARIRHGFGMDQIDDMIAAIMDSESTRQAVLNIWHPSYDRSFRPQPSTDKIGEFQQVKHNTKDRACNVLAMALVRNGLLEWTQIMRSNDAMWGTPYNFIQWAHVMRYVSIATGWPLGSYTHFANSLHIYHDKIEEARSIVPFDLYAVYKVMGHAPWRPQDATQGHFIRLRAAASVWQGSAVGALQEAVPPVEDIGEYWHAVLTVMRAYALNKWGYAEDAARVLLECPDPVLGMAQFRHLWFWHWRYRQDDTIRHMLLDHPGMPLAVVQWITDIEDIAPPSA